MHYVVAAVFALLATEFLPPRAPRFLGVLLGIATPVEICARMAFSVGAAGDGIEASDFKGTAALATLAGMLFRAASARGAGSALVARACSPTGAAAGTWAFGVLCIGAAAFGCIGTAAFGVA